MNQLKKKIQVEIDQRFSKIESKEGDARKDKDIRFKRRKVMRKRYYSTVLELMEEKKYEAAAIEYLQLTNRHLKKNDFETSSLMILLYGLSLLKAGESLKLIKKKTTDFLNSLGVNKKLIEIKNLLLMTMKVFIWL